MSLKARLSILTLFDPLLADALHVPLPDTPPLTPRSQDGEDGEDEDGEDRKENEVPGDAMSLFFDSFMKKDKTMSYTRQSVGLLINIEEDEEVIDVQRQSTPTTPLTTDKTTDRQPSFSLHTLPLNFAQDAEDTCDPIIPPLLVVSETPETPETLDALLFGEKQPMAEPQAMDDSYSTLSVQSHNRRRSSIDIPRTLSSFSSGLLEPGASNFDLIQEELSLLSAFSEDGEGDSSHNWTKIEPPTFSTQEVEAITSPGNTNLSTPISATFEKHFQMSGELAIPETEPAHQKQSPQGHLNKGSYLMDDSDCQLIDMKESRMSPRTALSSVNNTPSNPHVTMAISAPKRPKVFTLDRQHMFKPNPFLKPAEKTENMGNSSSKPTSSLAQTRVVSLGDSDSGNVPVKAIPRLHKAPSVKQVTAPESKIPSRVTAQTDGSSYYKPMPTYTSFGGASRIAVPLKKGLRKT